MVLIESDWNLKCFNEKYQKPSIFCINRIRLEFKVSLMVPAQKNAGGY